MNSKTVKEFAKEVNLDKKQLQNRLAYWKKKGKETWNFSESFSEGVRILTIAEQKRVYELLKIPVFSQFSDEPTHQNRDNLSLEKIAFLENQILEIKSDKEYLKGQLLQGQKEKSELLKSNAELRILLQNVIKQNESIQLYLSENSSGKIYSTGKESTHIVKEEVLKDSEKQSESQIVSQIEKKNFFQNAKDFFLKRVNVKK